MDYYQLILEKLPDDVAQACRLISKEYAFPGFRRGKTPVHLIINYSKVDYLVQQKICIIIATTLFPDQTLDDVLRAEWSLTDPKSLGYLAAYIGSKKPVPYSVADIEAACAASQAHDDAPDEPAAEDAADVPALDDAPATLDNNACDAPQDVYAEDAADVPALDDAPATPENDACDAPLDVYAEDAADVPALDDAPATPDNDVCDAPLDVYAEDALHAVSIAPHLQAAPEPMLGFDEYERYLTEGRFLGNIQIVYLTGSPIHYHNFHPFAKMDSDGTIHYLTTTECVEGFPTLGNVNLYARGRSEAPMLDALQYGDMLILDITKDLLEENKRNATDLYSTQRKISIAALYSEHAIHHPQELGLYPVIYCPNAAEQMVLSGGIIWLDAHDVQGIRVNADVLIRMKDNTYAGPFTLGMRAMDNAYFLSPQPLRRNYLFNIYQADAAETCLFENEVPVLASSSSWRPRRSYAMLSKMSMEVRDFISDEQLYTQFAALLSGRSNEDMAVKIEEKLASDHLPEPIAVARRERLRILFNCTVVAPASLTPVVPVPVAKPAPAESSPEEIALTDQAAILAQQVQEKKEQLQQAEQQLQHTEQQLQQAKEQFEQSMEKLQPLLSKLKLVEDIQQLTIAQGVAEELLRRTRQEQAQIREATVNILTSFHEQVRHPMEKLAEAALNTEVEAILSRSVDQAIHQGERHDEQAMQTLTGAWSAACDSTLTRENLVETLCRRIAAYRPYERNEIINFLICLEQSFLTIFSGPPGNGKTSICAITTHALGLDHEKSISTRSAAYGETVHTLSRYVVVPVERGWNSKRDFVGYYNPLTKTFDKANSAVYQALKVSDMEARSNAAQPMPPSVIMLDEANLSPMEYYWADFMSVCDGVSASTILHLSERNQFKVADSLRFMATINHDHTTENISPRLIDRAWIISLPPSDSVKPVRFGESYPPVPMSLLHQVFDAAEDTQSLPGDMEALLSDIYSICQSSLMVDVSPRAKLAIQRYCQAGSALFAPDAAGRTPSAIAVDYAVAQKLLPKVQGSGASYRQELEAFRQHLQSRQLTRSADAVMRILQHGDRNMQYYQFFA